MGFFDFLKPKGEVNRGYLATADQEMIRQRWQTLESQMLGSTSPAAKRQAVIEADKILDYALDRLYPNLTTTGERLKLAKENFRGRWREYDELWFAHKVRNEMVHKVDFEMPAVEVHDTISKFKKGLEVLGALR
jgi:hypothetical protein